MIDERDIDRAKRVDLPSFLEFQLGLKRGPTSGSGIFFHSPFRDEYAPSLHVSQRDGVWVWYDHGSSERRGGDSIELLRELGYSFKDAVTTLVEFDGGRIEPRMEKKNKKKEADPLKRLEKVIRVREFYENKLQKFENVVKRYFEERRLAYYPELGCKIYMDFKDKTRYIAFPVPSLQNMRGLELRELKPVNLELKEGKKRKSFGTKTLWVFKRDPKRLLIAESIVDCLAAERLFNETSATLVALNGVGQASEIKKLLETCNTYREAVVVIDNDEVGKEAKEIVNKALSQHSIKIEMPVIEAKDPFREYIQKIS